MKRFLSFKALARVMIVAVLFGGVPTAAYATTHTYTFATQSLPVPGMWTRLPASSSSDKTATRTNSSGTVSMDVSTCPNPPAKWGGEFKRNINNFPDYRVVLADGQDYCMTAYLVHPKITKNHKYYFRVMNLRVTTPPKATGTFKWSY